MTISSKTKASAEQIRDFILERVAEKTGDVISASVEHFGLSRQSISRYLQYLVREGLLKSTGETRARKYSLRVLGRVKKTLELTHDLQEDVIYREYVLPIITNLPDNVLTICNYGFTEMVNNVISHSEGTNITFTVERDSVWTAITVVDDGVGIFPKIQRAMGLKDQRHALLELAKGKLTTDPDLHTGEGIFFTSRMFDEFWILAGTLFYGRKRQDGEGWLIETEDRPDRLGTLVEMRIKNRSSQTAREVFDQYATGADDFSFSKTHVPVKLAKYERDQLLSRSAARRLLARFEKFKEVMLDFEGIDSIGPAFADEIFRVFKRSHPEIDVLTLNANSEIQRTIARAQEERLATL